MPLLYDAQVQLAMAIMLPLLMLILGNSYKLSTSIREFSASLQILRIETENYVIFDKSEITYQNAVCYYSTIFCTPIHFWLI